MITANSEHVSRLDDGRPLEELTDEELVTAHLEGRPGAFQRLYDRPFVLMAFGFVVMLVLFTAWGLWEVMTLPTATLP